MNKLMAFSLGVKECPHCNGIVHVGMSRAPTCKHCRVEFPQEFTKFWASFWIVYYLIVLPISWVISGVIVERAISAVENGYLFTAIGSIIFSYLYYVFSISLFLRLQDGVQAD